MAMIIFVCWPCQTALENTYKYKYIYKVYIFVLRENDRKLDNVSILIEIIGEWGLIVIYNVFFFRDCYFWFSVIFFVSFSIEYRLFTLKYIKKIA